MLSACTLVSITWCKIHCGSGNHSSESNIHCLGTEPKNAHGNFSKQTAINQLYQNSLCWSVVNSNCFRFMVCGKCPQTFLSMLSPWTKRWIWQCFEFVGQSCEEAVSSAPLWCLPCWLFSAGEWSTRCNLFAFHEKASFCRALFGQTALWSFVSSLWRKTSVFELIGGYLRSPQLLIKKLISTCAR